MAKPKEIGRKKPLKLKDLRATKNPRGGAEKVAKLGLDRALPTPFSK